jgi:hypothetical protein
MSDPDDSSVVYATETDDGTRGLLVDAFGPYADPEVGRLLERVRIRGRASARPELAGTPGHGAAL